MRLIPFLCLALAGCPTPAGDGDGEGYDFAVGPTMFPGDNCRACHKPDSAYPDAPVWTVAGTVFDGPEGTMGQAGVVVRVLGADGEVTELTTNAVGNFYTPKEIAVPYRVEVERDGRVAAMPMSPPAGGCNACHGSEPIGGAPGALWVPDGDWTSTVVCQDEAVLLGDDGTSYPCGPYLCVSGPPDACSTSCEGPEDCAAGASCDEGRCVSP
jgi:hypothetical protein